MADIFISYASEDRPRIEPLAKALEDQGWSVFWDRTIPAGKTWRQVIGDALETARSVIVAWSKTSVDSRWVQEEADRGLERNILVPILIDNVKPPLGFGTIQAADLISWEPTQSSPEFEKLIFDLSAILGPSPLKVKEAEQKRAEEELRYKQDEEAERKKEEQRKTEEERQRLKEHKRIEAAGKAEEERKHKEAEVKNKAEEVQKREEVSAKIKPDEPKPEERATTEAKPPKPRKTSNALKLGAVASVIVLLVVGIWWYIAKEAKPGKLFVIAVPDKATVKIQDIDEPFQQGMKLKPGEYHIEVSLKDYKPQSKSINLGPGEEKRINFELEKIAPKVGWLFVKTFPEDATVRILNIKPKFSQGMELEPGRYHVEIAAEGYETRREWINLEAGHEEPFRFELTKIKIAEQLPPQETFTNSIDMKFVLIPKGKFVMGSPLDEPEREDDEKKHEVIISKPFYLQTTEVSQGQWQRVMGDNPSKFKDCGDDCPVEQVSWDDAQEFISELNRLENTKKYRLPTEAEWEYACRAGTTTIFSTGDCISTNQANYNGNYPIKNCPKGEYREKTVKVGSLPPNDWGLYEMHGNVYEWCQDWRGDYPSSSVVDPKGPAEGKYRVARGGSYSNKAWTLRSADRAWDHPFWRYFLLFGFRVARDF